MARKIREAAGAPGFVLDLLSCLEGDPWLYRLVDKTHALPRDYEPGDLVELRGEGALGVTRRGLRLRRTAAESLEEMAAAAAAEGIGLTAASCYRS
jgi:D-alanyl-D-alanine carboxypeptidase